MPTIQEERAAVARGDGRAVVRPVRHGTVRHAIAAWETDAGANAGPDARALGVGTTRITQIALIWPYDGVIAGIWPLDPDTIAGIVTYGYQVLATVRDHPPYTHVIGAHGGQDYLVTLATIGASPAAASPPPPLPV